MSKTVDERVVSMQFDNKQFEQNVKTSMSTIEKLKQSLKFKNANEGLNNIESSVKKVNMKGLGSAVEAVGAKFSALQVMGVTALANITNSAVNAGKRLVSAFTIDPIKTGFQEYETQINAVQTILANTQSKGTTLDDVNAALDELNAYADKTIYNFTEMTRNIGTFTAAGIDLDTSVSAIQGIANLAAVSGSTSQQASTAMYQLSQALASGTVKLQDWNSVVNAGMGGQVFQDALKKTAEAHGVNVDAMIKKNGSFRESLKEGWITSEILTETLGKMTKSGAAEYLSELTGIEEKQITAAQKAVAANKDGSASYEELAEKMAETGKVSKGEAMEILKMADTAEDAATKVKTFSQLMDTLKEAAQSGWTQTWEILIGDFEEAKTLWTDVSDYFSEVINKSAEARNNMLSLWAKLGGRDIAIDSLKNAFEGLLSIINPIKEAFRDIFPKMKINDLMVLTKRIHEITEKMKLNEDQQKKLKAAFKGLFSVIDIGITFVKDLVGGIFKLIGSFSGAGNSVLDTADSLGNLLSGFRDNIKEADIFGKAIDGVVGFLQKGIEKIKEFYGFIKEKIAMPGFEGFLGILKNIWDFIKKIGGKISEVGSSMADSFSEAFRNGDISKGIDILNGGLITAILLGVKKFVGNFGDAFEDVAGMLDNVKGILGGVKDCLTDFQSSIKAKTLLTIASAMAILAASIVVISLINQDKLASSLGTITVLFADLLGAMAIFSRISDIKGSTKAVTLMIGMSIAVLILASAMKKLSQLSWEGIGKGLAGVGSLMGMTLIFLNNTKFSGKVFSAALGIVVLSSALKILASVCKDFGGMKWSEIGKGLAAIGALLIELALFTKLTGNSKHVVSTGIALVLIGASMKIFASAVKDFSNMRWEEIGKGLAAIAGALAAVTLAVKFMPKNMIGIGVGLVLVSSSLLIMANVLSKIGGMSWEEIGKGLATLGGSIAILAIGLNFMKKTIAGSVALLIAAGALAVLSPVLVLLGSMSWKSIAKGLITLAGAFTVIGIAGLLLRPLIPTILGLAGAFALIGVGTLAVGMGLIAISAGISALSVSVAAGATAIVAALAIIINGILDFIPTIADKLRETISTLVNLFLTVFVESVPAIAEGVLKLISKVLESLAEYTPQIVDSLCSFFINLLTSLADRLPEIIEAAMSLIMAFFSGVVNALKSVDVKTLIEGIIGIGLIAGLMAAFAAVAGLVPAALVGVIGMGAVITELSLVIAALGALAQLPGLEWLINEGGELLQNLGNAIGKLVGGLIGGIAEGITDSLPEIATDLSNFATNLKPFMDTMSTIDASSMEGAKALADVILKLTASNLLDGLSNLLGGRDMAELGAQLVSFGESLVSFSDTVKGNIDESAVQSAANAGSLMAEMQSKIVPSGGVVQWFTGEKDMAAFGEQLVAFGESIVAFSKTVSQEGAINETAIEAAKNAGLIMVELQEAIEPTGGVVDFFCGSKSLSKFGKQIKSFGESIVSFSKTVEEGGISSSSAEAAKNAGLIMVELQKAIPEKNVFDGKVTLKKFGKQVKSFGKSIADYSEKVSGIDVSSVSASVEAGKGIAETAKSLQDLDMDKVKNFDLSGIGDSLKSFYNSISGVDSVTLASSTLSISKLVDTIKSMKGLDTSGVTSFKAAINGLSTANVKGLANNFSSYNSQMSNVGSSLVSSINKGITSKQSSLTTSITSMMNKAANAAKAKTPAFATAGKTLMVKFSAGITSQKSKAASAFTSTLSSSITKVRGYYDNFYGAGKYLVSGFSAGISANTFRAEAKAKDMAEAAYKAAKDSLKINSPSKVFRSLAYSIPEGFAQGIDRKTGMVVSSSREMAITAINATKKSLSSLGNMVLSDIDSQPTIRPVLDLSDVNSGVSAINGMFEMQPSIGAVANIRAINSMMNNRQNGTNSDVVSAINKLGKSLDNAGSTSYTINGITYDDGTNISEAVQTLIRAARVERRM